MKIAYLQIIRVCDQNCIFCAQPQNGKVLQLKEVIKKMVYFKSIWIQKLIITWWEPTLHKDFLKIIYIANKFGFHIIIQTNWNQLSNEALVNWLKDYHNVTYIISLHSHLASIHDFLKRSSWSYYKTKRWITNLYKVLKGKVIIKLAIALTIYNLKYIKETVSAFLSDFPFLDGIIFNNLDTYNIPFKDYYMVPKLNSFNSNFLEALWLVLASWKTLNIERIPLCYLYWYEAYSDSLEYILWKDLKYVDYLQDDRKSEFINERKRTPKTAYWKRCIECSLKDYCWWIPQLWVIYKETDLIPQKVSKKYIDNILKIYYTNNNEG